MKKAISILFLSATSIALLSAIYLDHCVYVNQSPLSSIALILFGISYTYFVRHKK